MNRNIHLIETAIKNKKIINFIYDGCTRSAAPHHWGILSQKYQLQAYQIAGESKTEAPIGWKNFEIDKIKNLSLDTHGFHPRKDHNPSNSNYSLIKKSVAQRHK